MGSSTTYYEGGSSEMQSCAEGNLQTLYLMNPTYVPYPHTSNVLDLPTLSHAPPPNHHLLPHHFWPSNNSSPAQPQQQGLSLTLSPNHYNRSLSGDFDGGNIMNWSVILGSKYVKAAQEVLDEVVNVGKGIIIDEMESSKYKDKIKIIKPNTTSHQSQCDAIDASSSDLTTAQRQDLHMKKSKLLTMLDQVEQRYRQYREQMQIVMSSFEEAAGYGAAKSYTWLALRTISKQFRCLKDAISWQIKATRKRLGEEECLGGKMEGSRLRYVDHHLRQQRALQQLGMMQHNAWRPQRGLPERAVSILRAWLFEHFLHPYPKDSDKVMLAKQTGLTRSQVSNWFINARVRLWKPMVEEMYLEETKEQQDEEEQKSNNMNVGNSKDKNTTSKSKDERSKVKVVGMDGNDNNSNMMMRSFDDQIQMKSDHTFNINQASSSLSDVISSSSVSVLMDNNNNNNIMEMKPPNNPNMKDGCLSGGYAGAGAGIGIGIGIGFCMQDIGRFNVNNNNNVSEQQHLAPRFHGNGVSLTLGLPHSTTDNNHNLGFLSHLATNTSDLCGITTPNPPPSASTAYANLDIHNTKTFSTQLLPDFVT